MEFKLVERGTDYFAFEYEKDGKILAEITWNQRDGIMDMTHTFVSPKFVGKGSQKNC